MKLKHIKTCPRFDIGSELTFFLSSFTSNSVISFALGSGGWTGSVNNIIKSNREIKVIFPVEMWETNKEQRKKLSGCLVGRAQAYSARGSAAGLILDSTQQFSSYCYE